MTRAPSEKKIAKCRGRHFALRFEGEEAVRSYLARYFTEEEAGRNAAVGEVPGLELHAS